MLGGIVNLVDRDDPVYHALSVHLSRAKVITRFDDRYAVVKFSRVWSKVPQGRTLIFDVRPPSIYISYDTVFTPILLTTRGI